MPGDVAGDAAGDAAGDVADTIARLTGELEWCKKEITRLELLNHSLLAEKEVLEVAMGKKVDAECAERAEAAPPPVQMLYVRTPG